jgi:hypothetical protein
VPVSLEVDTEAIQIFVRDRLDEGTTAENRRHTEAVRL